MTKLKVSRPAEEELVEAAAWYEKKRAGLGVELLASVDLALDEVRNNPMQCPLWREDRPYRKKVLRRFPYVIFFRYEHEVVAVLAIAHVRRRPGFWIARSK